ncbi:filamentous hemagglutinin N-terminal domain-containing protein [Salmonella enterica]|nr:filamentous hemagglutinin N-terminal domain-containing protein [Salmonella enterica]EDO2997432.1 filamentous hemagglutinin N-terminal domain-containing protein [Salmonella enterica]EDS0530529.1 filamentous hemagglutinin N-terminal domain-containing protein [Salmonella enterica]EEF8499588.1 filamentous hemagglutinin N-terminal domain-containing protein [Salmonella enterica]EEL3445369.1 filamentous hemagglutinin N-terminal domain-containing protein [Salmonella enterica]
MNKIYKLKFDKRRNELVVVSEITAGMGKEKSTGHLADLSALSPFRKLLGTLTPLALLTGLIAGLLPAMVLAADLPTGGQIVGGQGSISSAGNQMTIHQQTQNMATNWHSFDIGKNNTVQFIQPDSSAVALNRVTGVSGSQIMGTLKANGQVFILNPNGVLFGKDARVNVAGLVASTKNINTADFMKGQYTLSGSGNPGAQVINQGSLTTTKGGYIVLAGERVSNSGTITTPSGKTVLAADKTVTLQLDNGGLTSVRVNGSVVNALVENRGLISATNGQVYLTAQGRDMLMNTVVNNSGTIEAKGLESRGGEIVLNGGDSGVVSQSGRVLADSLTGKGGKITLEGQNIHLAGNSLTSATGKTGGGEVYVGGGWQGKDSHIHNASKVVMDRSATVDVSATQNGNGGTAVLWSDDYTSFQGGILARGGAQSGNGGRVETSSHRNLQAFGAVDASARAGHGGEWLLDPTDVTIVSGDANTAVTESGKGTEATLDTDTEHVFSPSATGAQVSADKISEQLNAGTNVTVQTSGTDTSGQSGNITVNANISKSAGADASLTLAAGGNITLDGHSITATAGKLDVSLLAAGYDSGRIQVLNGSQVNTNGGNITLDQLNHTITANDGSMVSNTRALTLKITGGSTLNATSSGGESGDISLGVYNPNVNLSAPAYNGTVRNGGSMAEISGNSVLSGGNISLHSEQSGANAKHLPFYLNQMTINASGDINFSACVTGGPNVVNAEIRGANNSLTAKGNISLTSELSGSKGSALFFNGTKAGDIQLTAGKDIVLTGINPGSSDALYIKNTALSAGDRLILTGSAATGAGVRINNNSTLNASQAVITGTTTGGNTGFALTGTTLSGGLADLINVTFSSAGSAAGAINLLDSSVVNEANRENLLEKRIENMTSIDMGGTAIFDDSSATDKGWSHNYTLEDLPNHGWIFNNTSVNAGGLVQLTGVGFSNATMNITAGGLNISQSGPLQLTSTTMNVNGDVLLHSDMDLTLTGSRVNETAAGDAAVNITAGQNITLSGTNISATTGKIDVSLLAAGTDSGRIQVLNGSQVNTRGGNITLDQLNHTTATEDGSVSNPNAMTVKANNSKLNTSAPETTDGTASESGNITLNAYNPNVNLSAPAYNTTVRNAGSMLELSGNSTLTGRDLIMRTTLEGGNATGLPVFLNNATLNASHDITLSGVAHPVTTNTTADDGTVTTNTTTPALAAIELRGAGNVLTAGGNITIENPASGNSNGVYLNGNASGKAQLTAGGTITLNGSSAGNGAGVLVNNSILNASQAVITGSSSTGKGFSLTNTTLEGSLTDLANATFSSAGAGAGVTNLLDGSVVTSSNRDTMLGKSIENMTSIDMGGTAIFDDSAKDNKGWTHNYTHADNPNGGWIFNNTTVTAGGDVMLGGVGFTNSTVNVSSGNLSIDNNSAALLTGTTITVGDGAVNVHAGAGNIDLSKGNISAKGDITLQTDNGSISILGTSATAIASITSDSGNISITSNTATGNALTFDYVDLNAREGNISMSGVSSDGVGVVFKNGGYTASATSGHIDVYGRGETSGGSNSNSRTKGDIDFQGESKFKAKEGSISGRKVSDPKTSTPSIYWGSLFGAAGNVYFDGDFAINSTNGMYASHSNTFTFLNGNSSFTSDAGNAPNAFTGVSSTYQAGIITFNASNANVSMNFSSENENRDVFEWAVSNRRDGVVFSGDGNITLSAKGNTTGVAADMGSFNNLNMTGKLVVNVVNDLGGGLRVGERTTASLINADITGISNGGGDGIIFNGSLSGAVIDLNGNSFTGQSVTGNGVRINGNNVTITGGTLNGTSVESAGVAITGGSNYTIDGANVTGQSANGTGVSVTGNLAVNNDATIIGVSTGSGDGVNVNGTLLSDGGVTIKGDATTGSGVLVDGDTQLNNATVSGSATEGSGIEVKGNLTNTNTTLEGNATGHGAGVTIGGNITGGSISGESASGSGVLVSGTNTTVDGATISGNTSSGVGVNISGSLTNVNGTTVNGSAADGSGVTLGGNLSGGEVTGTSQTGSGVNITGDNSVADNTTLKGSSTNGTGVTISGNLTNTNGTTVNGTANGSGSGVDLSGNITGGSVTGNATGTGSGVSVSGSDSTATNTSISGNTADGTGVSISGNLTSAGSTTVSGNATGSGSGVHLNNGTVTGGLVQGDSLNGAGIRTEGHVNVSGSQLKGNSVNGTDLVVSGTLSHDPDTTIEAETVTGQENIQEVKPVTPPPATDDDGSQPGHDTDSGNMDSGSDNPAVDRPSVPSEPESQSERDPDASLRKETEVNTLRQGAVNAQVINMNQPAQDGFHASGTSPVPVKGYLPPERKVDISLCDGENCRSVSLNAARPAEGNVTPSGR